MSSSEGKSEVPSHSHTSLGEQEDKDGIDMRGSSIQERNCMILQRVSSLLLTGAEAGPPLNVMMPRNNNCSQTLQSGTFVMLLGVIVGFALICAHTCSHVHARHQSRASWCNTEKMRERTLSGKEKRLDSCVRKSSDMG